MDPDIYQIHAKAAAPTGKLPVTEDLLLNRPSGDLFGMTMDAGMGWNPAELSRAAAWTRSPNARRYLGPISDESYL